MEQKKFITRFKDESFPTWYVKSDDLAYQILEQLSRYSANHVFGIDLETQSLAEYKRYPWAALSPHMSKIRLIQLFTGKSIIVFDLNYIENLDKEFFKFLTSHKFIAHYAVFELMFLKTWAGRSLRIAPDLDIGCSMLMAKMVFHAARWSDVGLKAGLEPLVDSLLGVGILKKVQNSNWGNPDLTFEQVEYAALDAVCTLKVAEKLLKGIHKYGLEKYYKLCKAAQHPIVEMQLNGMGLNVARHRKMCEVWGKNLYKEKTALLDMTGLDKITPHKLSKYLENTLDDETLVYWPKTEKGKLKTDAHTFAEYGYLDIVQPISRFSKLDKLTSSFGSNLIRQCNPETGRLHSTFNLCGARTGRMSSSNPNCFTGDTEILTNWGWVRFDRLRNYEKVAQWDSGKITFVKPLDYIKTKASQIVRISNEHIDLKVSTDHRCLLQHRKLKHLKVFHAADYKEDWRQLHGGEYSAPKKSIYSDDFISLLVATQADGSWHAGGIDFGFYKKRKYNRLKSLLKACKVPYSEYKSSNPKRLRLRALKCILVEDMQELLGKDKLFGPWLFEFSQSNWNRFREEIFFWDGLWTRKNNYNSKHKQNADWVQIAFILNAQRCNVRVYDWNQKKKPNQSISYQCDVTRSRNYSMTTNVSKKFKNVSSVLYCVSVPSSFIVVRRNGKVCVTGNCQQLPRDIEVRKNFVPRKGFQFVVADLSQIELRVMAEITRDEEMLNAYRKGLDIHTLTASKVTGKAMQSVTKEERALGKQLGLGLLYGLGGKKFGHYARKGGVKDITDEEGKEAVKAFRKAYPGLYEWQKRTTREASKTLTSRTVTGKLRRLEPDNFYGASLNTPVQGSAAEVILYSLVRTYKLLRENNLEAKLCNCVHDETIIECPPNEVKKVKKILEGAMHDGYLDVFPKGITKGLAEATSGSNWGEAKG